MFCSYCKGDITIIDRLFKRNMAVGTNTPTNYYWCGQTIHDFKKTSDVHKHCHSLYQAYGEIYFLAKHFMESYYYQGTINEGDLKRIWYVIEDTLDFSAKDISKSLEIDLNLVQTFMLFLEENGKISSTLIGLDNPTIGQPDKFVSIEKINKTQGVFPKGFKKNKGET